MPAIRVDDGTTPNKKSDEKIVKDPKNLFSWKWILGGITFLLILIWIASAVRDRRTIDVQNQQPTVEAPAQERLRQNREIELTNLPLHLELKEGEVAQLVLPQGELAQFKVNEDYIIPFSPVTGEFKSSLGDENCGDKGTVTGSTCWGMTLFGGLPLGEIQGPFSGNLTLNISASMEKVTLPPGTKVLIFKPGQK